MENTTKCEKCGFGEDKNAGVAAFAASTSFMFPYVLNAAIELDIFTIIAETTDGDTGQMSPSELLSRLPIRKRRGESAAVLDSMLRLLASNSLLTCSSMCGASSDGGLFERRYGLTPTGKFFVRGTSGLSLVKYQELCYRVLETNKVCQNLKDAVLGGGILFEGIHGKPYYEWMKSNPEYSKIFREAMREHSVFILDKVLENYRGFEGLDSLVAVAGGDGAALEMILSKHPSIRGINFDLPEVVRSAPFYQGVEHVSGDMFVEVPKGEANLLKFTLHNWSDERCLDILRNCYRALPEGKPGKVIVLECMLPEVPSDDDDVCSKYTNAMDIMMMALFGGRQRTKTEFEYLAKTAGFSEIKVVCQAHTIWVMEFIKP